MTCGESASVWLRLPFDQHDAWLPTAMRAHDVGCSGAVPFVGDNGLRWRCCRGDRALLAQQSWQAEPHPSP